MASFENSIPFLFSPRFYSPRFFFPRFHREKVFKIIESHKLCKKAFFRKRSFWPFCTKSFLDTLQPVNSAKWHTSLLDRGSGGNYLEKTINKTFQWWISYLNSSIKMSHLVLELLFDLATKQSSLGRWKQLRLKNVWMHWCSGLTFIQRKYPFKYYFLA